MFRPESIVPCANDILYDEDGFKYGFKVGGNVLDG